MTRWFLISFKIYETVATGARLSGAIIAADRLIQAQTEAEAIEKFKRFGLKKNQEYRSHVNKTIL